MIAKLLNSQIAEEIRSIFQASYAVEAELLKAIDFPPLKRPISDYVDCDTEFYGYRDGDNLAAVIEIKNDEDATHIQSLVVHPKYFRKGIGSQLVQFVLETYDSRMFTVETGVANVPAIRLYRSFGFKETMQWDTDHGVRKAKFEMKLRPLTSL